MAKKKATVIAIANQKGGTAKTTTCENLGIGLADEGKDVLLVDVDPQGSLTIALGNQMPDEMEPTLADMMERVIQDEPILPCEGVLKHPEGVDLMPVVGEDVAGGKRIAAVAAGEPDLPGQHVNEFDVAVVVKRDIPHFADADPQGEIVRVENRLLKHGRASFSVNPTILMHLSIKAMDQQDNSF